jgi:hypothetical protein
VTVISHPGMTIVHPLVERGEAWELIRNAPEAGDLAQLPEYGHRRVVIRQGLLVHEGFQVDSSSTSRLMSLIPHAIEQVPEVYPGITTAAHPSEQNRPTKMAPIRWLRSLFRRHG